MLGHHADQSIDHRFGHGKTHQRRVDTDARGIAFGDHLAVMHHDHGLGAPERRFGRLLEGMVERGLQRGMGRLHQVRPGDFGLQRRRFRDSERVDVALENIWLLSPVPQHAAEPLMMDGMAAEHPGHRGIDSLCRAVDPEFEEPAQAAQAVALDGFGKHGLRIKPGDEGLGADIVRDHAGGDAKGEIGTPADAGRRQHRQQYGERYPLQPAQNSPPQPVKSPTGFSAAAAPRQPRAAPARDARRRHIVVGHEEIRHQRRLTGRPGNARSRVTPLA